jgi:hypothetical protein
MTIALLTIGLVVAIIILARVAVWGLRQEARAERAIGVMSVKNQWMATVMFELDELKELQREQAEAPQKPAPFVEEHEAWPTDIREALLMYPPELRGPTEQWIKDSRRVRISWDTIRSRVIQGRGGRLEDDIEEE